MSQFENVEDLKAEIQKLLGEINKDMSKLKSEVASLHYILEKDASLPTNAKLVNERLMVVAKEAGIDLDDVEVETSDVETSQQNESDQNASEHSTSEDESDKENGTQESTRNNEPTASTSNAASVAAATDKLKKKVKRTLR